MIPPAQPIRRSKADLSRPLRELLEHQSGLWLTVAAIDTEYRKTLSKDTAQPTAGAIRNALSYMARTAKTIERRISDQRIIEYRSSTDLRITHDNASNRE